MGSWHYDVHKNVWWPFRWGSLSELGVKQVKQGSEINNIPNIGKKHTKLILMRSQGTSKSITLYPYDLLFAHALLGLTNQSSGFWNRINPGADLILHGATWYLARLMLRGNVPVYCNLFVWYIIFWHIVSKCHFNVHFPAALYTSVTYSNVKGGDNTSICLVTVLYTDAFAK